MAKLTVSIFIIALLQLGASDPVPSSTIDFNHFWTYDETVAYLEYLETNFHDYGHIERYGTTLEGRELMGFCIESDHHHHADSSVKPVIIIEAATRPREWIGVMTAIYFLHEFVEHNHEYDAILDVVDIVVIPIANPDGYVYSHIANRNWNKNRRSVGSGCIGVDINANFGFQFARTDDPCAESYSGENYFSERESYQLSGLLSSPKYSGRISMYISLQAYGEQILLPYNYLNIGGGNTEALTEVANRAVNAIRAQNPARNYQVGIGAEISGVQHGTSADYAKGRQNIEYVFTFKLPRGSNSNGFILTVAEMQAVIAETFFGLHEMALYLSQK